MLCAVQPRLNLLEGVEVKEGVNAHRMAPVGLYPPIKGLVSGYAEKGSGAVASVDRVNGVPLTGEGGYKCDI